MSSDYQWRERQSISEIVDVEYYDAMSDVEDETPLDLSVPSRHKSSISAVNIQRLKIRSRRSSEDTLYERDRYSDGEIYENHGYNNRNEDYRVIERERPYSGELFVQQKYRRLSSSDVLTQDRDSSSPHDSDDDNPQTNYKKNLMKRYCKS